MKKLKFLFFKQAFTLTELVLVVIIISVLVSFGVPSYQGVIRRTREKNAIPDLMLIKVAQNIYFSETGHYYPGNGTQVSNIQTINEHLNLGLTVPDYVDEYYCEGSAADFDCRITVMTGGTPSATDWQYQITHTLTEPTCSAGNCSYYNY